MYDPYVYHLDLCILAYQLYNQTLIWPLDPWYEKMRRVGTSRRNKFMEKTHAFFTATPTATPAYRGPGATRNWPTSTALDPIIGKYARISPWRACFTCDGAKYRVFNTPAAIANKISDVYVYEYESNPAGSTLDLTRGHPREVRHLQPDVDIDGNDVLYAFEGATGATVEGMVINAKDPAWSLMGFVLKRMRGDGGYDVHVVFRGSQSGSAGPALVSGLITESGNPDWVTDMDTYTTVSAPIVSRQGEVCRGFSNSIKLCLNSIAACLNDIHHNQQGQAPTQIYVTGHSLGGALAAQFSSAVVLGQYGENLGDDLTTWPWDRLKLITYGGPTVGNKAFQAAFNARIDCKRIKVEGDPITQEKINNHVGAEIELPSKYTLNSAAHEPALIRSKLIENADGLGIDLTGALTGTPVPATTVPADEPWQVFGTFWEMYDGHAWVRDHLAEIVTAEFAEDLNAYVARFREIIDLNSTYRSPVTRQSVKDDLKRRLDAAFASAPVASVGELKTRIGQTKEILDDQDEFLALCLTLREALRLDARITLAQAKADVEVTESTYA